MSHSEIEIKHNSEKERFEFIEDGQLAELTYKKRGNTIYIMHTGVPETIGNRGIATVLAETALKYVLKTGLRLVVYCPFVKAYMQRHPNWRKELAT